jgi:predicted TIM-barrel fold metal-dependent hydrolase
MAVILPGREVHGMHFPLAFVPDTAPGNAWISQEIGKDPLSRGQFLVRPTDDPEWVRQEVRRLGLRGLKPFSTYSQVENCWEAEIPDYLPEPLVAVADAEGWSITLHLVRSRGVADPSNQHWIRHYCQKYPRMQLILDHCARGFNPYHALEGLPTLTGLDNLWVDTSVNCQPLAVEAVLRIIGPERTLYGSDFCISHFRGTNLGVADSFLWLYDDTPVWHLAAHTSGLRPTLVGLENLRAVKAACWSVGLSDAQIEDYFWGNAAQLLGVGV